MTYVVIVLCFIGMAAFLAWFLPRRFHGIAQDEFSRLLAQFKVMCPVASGILNRVRDLEEKASNANASIADVNHRMNRAVAEIEKYEKQADEDNKPVPVGTMGFNPRLIAGGKS